MEGLPQGQKKHSWVHIFVGFLLFLLGAGMSIFTLVFRENAIPAPIVVVHAESSTASSTFEYGPQPRLSEPSFFASTLASFKENKQTFIEADLSNMKIRYYDEGSVVFEAPILTKGKEGSWWETPAGLYSVESKASSHFSSFGKVYTPWNLVFQGNFFIHGWPYYPDNTPVSSAYSGGCIRLKDEDAEALYALARKGVPVLVYEKDYQSDGFSYATLMPKVDATAYLVADIDSGTILIQKGELEKLPIASITQLMTALIASEYINLDTNTVITQSAMANKANKANMATSAVERLLPDMEMSNYSLLLPLLRESSRVAANTFAQTLGTERFVSLMNKKATALGMTNTVFTNPVGDEDTNISTPQDLLRLATYISNNRSFIYKISSGENVSTSYNVYPFPALANFNPTPGLTGFIGGATGENTHIDDTILSVYALHVKATKRNIVFIILGSTDKYTAVADLYRYVQREFDAVAVGTNSALGIVKNEQNN